MTDRITVDLHDDSPRSEDSSVEEMDDFIAPEDSQRGANFISSFSHSPDSLLPKTGQMSTHMWLSRGQLVHIRLPHIFRGGHVTNKFRLKTLVTAGDLTHSQ